ncbi:hypothetical protein JTE90_011689 [Oedothorax gibbosus]|uniref:Uncharacterized protein n=1 Tax=Oedothorax gibbosus TaxID=931172 RepID=A0AAV6USY2_9ARAC|nr:hypothetical protein JTE90_011689 [Oedothorax gibbosus]
MTNFTSQDQATIFSKLLWTKYEEYQNLYLDTTLPLLKEKESSDEDFVALCQLRQGAAKYSLAALLELPVSPVSFLLLLLIMIVVYLDFAAASIQLC